MCVYFYLLTFSTIVFFFFYKGKEFHHAWLFVISFYYLFISPTYTYLRTKKTLHYNNIIKPNIILYS